MGIARLGTIAGFAIAAVYVGVVGGLYLGQRLLFYPSYMVDRAESDFVPPGVELVDIPTADGENLRGFWRAPTPGRETVIAFHGNASSASSQAVRFNGDLWNGYGFLVVTFRGYPGSTGSTSESGIIADSEAGLAFAKSREPNLMPIFYGHSLGASAAVALSSKHPSVALILEAPFYSMADQVRRRVPFVPQFLILDTLRSDERIPLSQAETIVIVHGTGDSVIPQEAGRALASRNPRAGFISAEGADHVSVIGSFDRDMVSMLDRRRQGLPL